MKLLDGLILLGGCDVDFYFYGEEFLEKLEVIFFERDVYEMVLIRVVIDLKKFIFVICCGM